MAEILGEILFGSILGHQSHPDTAMPFTNTQYQMIFKEFEAHCEIPPLQSQQVIHYLPKLLPMESSQKFGT